MSKFLRINVSKTFYSDILVKVPSDFDLSTLKEGQVRELANAQIPISNMDIRPWKEDVEAFEMDIELLNDDKKIDELGIRDYPDDIK